MSENVGDIATEIFGEEVEEKPEIETHYLRFDTAKKTKEGIQPITIRLADGTEICPGKEGWEEVQKFLHSKEAKNMLRNLIGVAIAVNSGKYRLVKVEETPTETETPETPSRRRRG